MSKRDLIHDPKHESLWNEHSELYNNVSKILQQMKCDVQLLNKAIASAIELERYQQSYLKKQKD
jgi:hypothetical protein